MREDLKFGQDRTYNIESMDAGREWNWKHKGNMEFGFPGSPNVMGDLVEAMISDTYLRVQVENGLYDLATPFLATEHTMEHLGLPEKLQTRIRMNYYDAGHMMYLRKADLAKLKSNVACFIQGVPTN